MGGHEAHYAILCRAQMIQPTASEPGGPSAPRGDTYQWARKGRQGTELLVVLRRVMRMARDWRVPVWVVKLDIRKAFDSVWQESMGQLVDARVGRLLASGGTAMGGQPWEARVWLGLLEAREMRVAMGDLITSIPQSNGVRQGSPGQSCLQPSLPRATALDEVLGRTSRHLPAKDPTPPKPGAFMDDTYLWSHDRDHLQRMLAELEVRLGKDGLAVHPGKTAILYSEPEEGGPSE